MAAAVPMLGAPNGPQPGPQGYQGLSGLMALLQGGLNQSQFSNLQAGYTGANGAVGGANGAFSGLSPWAVHFLTTTPGLFTQGNQMASDPLTGPANADGTPGAALTGSQLLMAQIHNGLAAQSPSTYKLADGLTQQNLAQMLQDYATSSGHSAYAKGDNAQGVINAGNGTLNGTPGAGDGGGPPMQHPPGPTVPDRMHNQHPWSTGVVGYGKDGGVFHSAEAARAAGRFHKGAPARSNLGSGRGPVRMPKPPAPARKK